MKTVRRRSLSITASQVTSNTQSTDTSFWKSASFVVVAILVLVGLVAASLAITSAITSNQSVPLSSPKVSNTTSTTPQETPKPSTMGRVFVFMIMATVVASVLIVAYREKRGTRPNRPRDIPWKEILLQPVFVTALGLVVLNAMASLFVYSIWRWFWDHQTLFWATNMSLVIFAHFQTKKETYAKVVAIVMGFLIFVGFVTVIHAEKPSGDGSGNSRLNTVASLSSRPFQASAPEDVVLSVIAGCESGNGTPGSGRQFSEDSKPMHNPSNPEALGEWQINLADPTVSGIVKEHNWNVANSRTDNLAAARFLYEDFISRGGNGTSPWDSSKYCWEPQLIAMGYGGIGRGIDLAETREYTKTVEAPVGEYRGEAHIAEGVYFSCSMGDSGIPFAVQDQKGSVARHDPQHGIVESLPYPSRTIRFTSLGNKPAEVVIRFARHPFAKTG